MADAQRVQLLQLFDTFDDGDGQLSISEFNLVIEAATPEATMADVLDLYKRCLAKSAEMAEEERKANPLKGGADDDDDDDRGMDAIKPEGFLAVVLPHLLSEIQVTLFS